MTITWFLTLLFAAPVTLPARAAAQGGPVTYPTFDANQVPWLLRTSRSGKLMKSKQEACATADAVARTVTLHWTSSQYVGQAPDWSASWDQSTKSMGNCRTLTQEQVLTTRYYPTSCAAADATTLLVGGIDAGGATVVEAWHLEWVAPMPTPIVDGATGLLVIPIAIPNVQRTRLYTADEAGRRYVAALAGLRVQGAETEAALVQFYDSQDVYVLDLNVHTLLLLASANAPGAIFSAPESLSVTDHTGITCADRTDVGFVYTFSRGKGDLTWLDQPYDTPILTLIDSDRDGDVDSFLQLSDEQFTQGGWDDLSNYTDWWLY